MLPSEPTRTRVPSWSRRRSTAAVVVAAATAFLVAFHVARPTGAVGDAGYLLGLWLGAALSWWGAYVAPRARRMVPGLIALGLTTYAVGGLAWEGGRWSGRGPDASFA